MPFICVNVRENRRCNQEWAIQKHRQDWKQDRKRRHTKQKTQHRKLNKRDGFICCDNLCPVHFNFYRIKCFKPMIGGRLLFNVKCPVIQLYSRQVQLYITINSVGEKGDTRWISGRML